MITAVTGARLLLDGTSVTGKDLYFEDGVITAITDAPIPCDRKIDADGRYLSPGFIDLHAHGGGGADFMDGGIEPILRAAETHLRHGTTGILATSLTSSHAVLTEFLRDLSAAMPLCPNLLGAHLEGPYLSPAQAGAQNPEYLRNPDPNEYLPLLDAFGSCIRRWDFAPELPGAVDFCSALTERHVIPAIAHSDATLSDVEKVYLSGCRLITHLYSGMSTITRKHGYRRLGVTEAGYYFPDMDVELIADGSHLPPELLRMVLQLKSSEHICLITDSMRGAGMPEGPSFLGRKGEEMPCIIEDGVAKLPDRSAFAGSVATADRLLRTLVTKCSLPVERAVTHLTSVPARILSLTGKGALRVGADADLVLFDDHIEVSRVILAGNDVPTAAD